MKSFSVRFSLSLLLAIVCVQPVFAQQREWSATGFIGSSFGRVFRFPTPVSIDGQKASQDVGIRYSSGYELGTRITQRFHSLWGADLQYSFSDQPVHFSDLSPDIHSLSFDQFVHHFSYNVSYFHPVDDQFQPYATVGVGSVLFYLPESSKVDGLENGVKLNDSWEFVFNWGGGFTYLIKDPLLFRVEVRDQMSGVPSYGLPNSARIVDGKYQPGIARTGLFNNWQINIGLGAQWD